MCFLKKKIAFYGEAGSGKDYVFKKLDESLRKTQQYFLDIDDFPTFKKFAFAEPVKECVKGILNLTASEFEKLHTSEDFKNNMYVNLDTLERVYLDPKEEPAKAFGTDDYKIVGEKDLPEYMQPKKFIFKIPHLKIPHLFISMRNLLVYYGTYVMQHSFGKDIWVKSVFNSAEFKFAESNPNIIVAITDLRFPHEYEACLKKGFTFIHVIGDETMKKAGQVSNIAESSYDAFTPQYTFVNTRNEKDLFSKILDLRSFILGECEL